MAFRVPGFRAVGIHCGLKAAGALDLALIASDRPAAAAGLFTRNRFPGAPVIVSRQRLRGGRARAIVVNSAVANVANGKRGLAEAREMSQLVARELGVPVGQVQVASTGVIGRPLPMDRIRAGIPAAARALSPAGWNSAAAAILTTDTRPKLVHVRTESFSLLGLAKGAGMVMPDMATLLVFLVTDLPAEASFLRPALRRAVAGTLNCLSIDGETSTSDCVVLMANGAAGGRVVSPGSRRARVFERALLEVCEELTQKLAADGEGVTRLAEIRVSGAADAARADRVARRIANSVLVKTALFGGDPNWGRIVQATGAAGVAFRPEALSVEIGGVCVLRRGEPVADPKALALAARAMRRRRVTIHVKLGRGRGRARVLSCDLSYEYVRINAEYTT